MGAISLGRCGKQFVTELSLFSLLSAHCSSFCRGFAQCDVENHHCAHPGLASGRQEEQIRRWELFMELRRETIAEITNRGQGAIHACSFGKEFRPSRGYKVGMDILPR